MNPWRWGIVQWEYKWDDVYDRWPLEISPGNMPDRKMWSDEQLKKLNDLGAAGWELVGLLGPHVNPLYPSEKILSKRPIAQKG